MKHRFLAQALTVALLTAAAGASAQSLADLRNDAATAVNATKAAGVDNASQLSFLKTLTTAISDFQTATAQLDKALGHHVEGEPYAHAKHMRDTVLAPMLEVRKAGDALESMVADDLWPLPTYREILFIK